MSLRAARKVAGLGALAALTLVALPLPATAVTTSKPSAVATTPMNSASASIGASAGSASAAPPAHATDLEGHTGLEVTIDAVRPARLTPGKPFTLSGSVTNVGRTHWRDAQVYLEIVAEPATSKAGLDAFASPDTVYGTRIVAIGLFDQIGSVRPGATVDYRLDVPFSRLPIAGTPGVYDVGVDVLAQNRAGRDTNADARVTTVVPLLPPASSVPAGPTSVVTLLPLTAAVARLSNGNFLNDTLTRQLAEGGRLRNVLDFAAAAPRNTVQVVLDPALRDAVATMANGYVVQTVAQARSGHRGQRGRGRVEAAAWEQELAAVDRRQQLSLLPWGAPDISALAASGMPGVVQSAVTASSTYAENESLDAPVVGWQPGGVSTRRGLSVQKQSGTSVQVVAERSLQRLQAGASGYPPTVVSLHSQRGPLTVVVTQGDVGGMRLTASMPPLQLRQHLMAEATVRWLLGDPQADSAVVTLPVSWDPGSAAGTVSFSPAYRSPAVQPTTAGVVAERRPTPYVGPVGTPTQPLSFPTAVSNAIVRLRDNGRIVTGVLRNSARATQRLDEQLGVAGSAAWRGQPRRATAMIRLQATALRRQIDKVTVTGPTFVALSSESGRFPLTVTNGLRVPISVRVEVKPMNPALQVDSIDNLQLAAGQRRDVQVVSRARGSGLTQVRVRLSTPDSRPFGAPWMFNVRATQFGVVIWIAMGVGAAVLFGAAALRIYRRIRESRRAAGDGLATR